MSKGGYVLVGEAGLALLPHLLSLIFFLSVKQVEALSKLTSSVMGK